MFFVILWLIGKSAWLFEQPVIGNILGWIVGVALLTWFAYACFHEDY